ncbi:MAG: hypothetical protein ACYDBQ_01040 [Thermoplasmatota archaeon]
MARLEASRPQGVVTGGLSQANTLISDWVANRTAEALPCLSIWGAALARAGAPPPPTLFAIVYPNPAYPTRVVHFIGDAPAGAAVVSVYAGDLGLALNVGALPTGAFGMDYTLPRSAVGRHDIAVSSGGERVNLTLTVIKAPVQIGIDAPAAAAANTSFTASFSVTAPLAAAEWDMAPLVVHWNGGNQTLRLSGGHAELTLAAAARRGVLEACFAGTDVLDAGCGNVLVVTSFPRPLPAASEHSGESSVLLWVFGIALGGSVLLAGALAAKRWLRGAQGTSPSPVPVEVSVDGGLVAVITSVFGVLRKFGLVPPGRTVREWIASVNGPPSLAAGFDATRYGGFPDRDDVRGVAWLRGAWRRLVSQNRDAGGGT